MEAFICARSWRLETTTFQSHVRNEAAMDAHGYERYPGNPFFREDERLLTGISYRREVFVARQHGKAVVGLKSRGGQWYGSHAFLLT